VLSVILAVHQDQAYLDGSARSVLDGSGPEVELVIVDNASTNHVPEIVTDLVANDDRVVAVRLDAAVEHGTARAKGLEVARGEFVWFLDATDRLEPGATETVVELVGRREADVVLTEYLVGGPLTLAPSARAEMVQRLVGRKAVTVDVRPDVLDLAPSTWSLIIRRGLLSEWGISPVGSRSEAAVGYCALLAARKIAAAPGVLYRRQLVKNAAHNPIVHGSDVDLVEDFERVFAFVDAHADALEQRRGVLPGRMVRAATQRVHRVAADDRRRFARRLVTVVGARSRRDDPLPPGRLTALRMRLVRGRHVTAYLALERMLRFSRGLAEKSGRLGGWSRGWLRKALLAARLAEYRLMRLLPLRPGVAVYGAYWYRGYSCNPRAIYEKMREIAPDIRGVWVVEPGGAVPAGVESVVAGTRAYYRLLARATYFVNNVNFPDHWRKRRGMVHLQTHHGTPLKRMGLDLRDAAGAGQRMNFRNLMRRCSTWDYSLSSNRLTTLVWERVYPLTYTTLEYGYPRNDRLANATELDTAEARAELGIAPGKRVMLYAPTHREYERSFRPILDTAHLADVLGEDWVILSRAHYFYDTRKPISSLADGRLVDVTSFESIETLSLASDVLVTDYSSVMFDYAVLDRPILIYAADWETYRSLRGTYFDLMAEPPGLVCRAPEEVADALLSGSYTSDVAKKARADFRARFCAWDDGNASERVVRRFFLGEQPLPPAASVA
jgi:CDP-glycerol glycerophosphotransferase